MSFVEVAFYISAALALVGGVGLAVTRNVVHGALFLILALLAAAGLYFVLLADFLALVQVLLYAGGVTILMLFAMMLTQVREHPLTLDTPQKPWAALVALAFFVGTVFVAYGTRWRAASTGPRYHINFEDIGAALFGPWAIPFEIASLVLLVALIGAIIIARQEERE